MPRILHGRHAVAALILLLGGALSTPAQEARVATESAVSAPERWAVILVGLPGDDEFATVFEQTTAAWRTSLTKLLDIPPDQVMLLQGDTPDPKKKSSPATRAAVQETFESLSRKLRPDDALWLLVMGHGNYDGQAAFLHLPGRDVDDALLGRLLEGVRCREQVIWLTNSSSGWFVRRLSRPGRIVITATAADFEFNATEFPIALGKILQRPAAETDEDHDGRLSVRELFLATAQATLALFQADERIPTETAQLDDNGDGKGTASENLVSLSTEAATATEATPGAGRGGLRNQPDGKLAATIGIAYRQDVPPSSPVEAPEPPK